MGKIGIVASGSSEMVSRVVLSEVPSNRIRKDLAETAKMLRIYVDKGRVVGRPAVEREPVIAVKPKRDKIKPLKR